MTRGEAIRAWSLFALLALVGPGCDLWLQEEPYQPPPEPIPIRDVALATIQTDPIQHYTHLLYPFARHFASTDDLDGDGHSDLLVGYHDEARETPEGSLVLRVFSSSSRGDVAVDQAIATMGWQGEDAMKVSIYGNGDLNGDGWDDYVFVDSEHPAEGVFAVAGGQLGEIPTDNPLVQISFDSWICEEEIDPRLLLHVQDLTHDGIADVIAWCNTIENNPTYGSFDYLGLFRGPLSGELSAWDADLLIFETIGDAANLGGGSVYGIGDWSGDGVDELMIPAWKYQDTTWNAFLFVDASTTGQVDRRDIDDALLGDDEGGVSYVSAAGDVNNDGYADITFGVYEYDSEARYLAVAHGPIEGPVYRADAQVFTLLPPSGAWRIGPIERSADMDGDGWVDLLVTAHVEWEDDRLYVVHGPLEGACTLEHAPSVGSFTGNAWRSLIDDIDGDALPDLAVYDEERALVYLLPGTVL